MSYDLKRMKSPRAAGTLLRAFVTAIENPATGALLADKLLGDAGIKGLRDLPADDAPNPHSPVFDHGRPHAQLDGDGVDLDALLDQLPEPPRRGYAPESSADFVAAYREGRKTPLEIAERALAIVRDSERRDPPSRT